MAKLNGVKTVDMVNGEITKVAYDGAEYEVIGADNSVMPNDIVRINSNNIWDGTKGAFYAVGNDGEYRDNDGDLRDPNFGSLREDYDGFRKIAVQTPPSLEVRVAELETEVAALKGEKAGETITHEGATYRKVDREAREGDVVIFTDATADRHFITKNMPYKAVDNGGFVDSEGDRMEIYANDCGQNRTRKTVDVYAPVATPKTKFAVGDYVKVVKSVRGDEGAVAVITGIGKYRTVNGYREFKVKSLTGKNVGQESEGFALRRYSRKSYEVKEDDDSDLYLIDDVCDENYDAIVYFKYEILSADEAKWAKLGRKVNEFRKGDIVRAKRKDYEGYGTIEDAYNSDRNYGVRFANGDFRAFFVGDGHTVELIAPVDAIITQ